MTNKVKSLMFAAICQLVCSSLLKCSGSECEFHQQWRGTWSPDLNSDEKVRITSNEITSKGLCYQQHRDYHLIENRREHCHQCLLLQEKHRNILQYKESYCIGRTALQSICGQIEVDRQLSVYTLVRADATPSECPLQRAYHVTYSNFSGCFCRSPTSYAHTCSSKSSLVFELRQCRQCSNTYEQNVELECLATWKEGSKYFGMGRFSSYIRSDKSKPDSNGRGHFRCFMYHILGAVAYISVSNNASCESLSSAREGPLLLELTEDFFGWPNSPTCSFPSWLTASRWFVLPNSHLVFEANDSNDTIVGRSSSSSPSSSSDQNQKSFKCLRIDQNNSTPTTTTARVQMLVQAFDECQATYRCITLVKKKRNMASLHVGREVEAGGRCSSSEATRTSSHLLVASTEQENSRCPLRGRYVSTSPSCRVEMKISCGSGDGIEMTDPCNPGKVERMTCLSSWGDHGGVHLVAERAGGTSVSCFTFQHLEDTILVSLQEDCLKHPDYLPSQYNSSSSFLIQFKDKCKERANVRSNEHSLDSFLPSIVQSDDFQRPRPPVPILPPSPSPSTSPHPPLPVVCATLPMLLIRLSRILPEGSLPSGAC